MIKSLLAIKLRASILTAFAGKDKSGNVKKISGARVAGMTIAFAILGLSVLMLFFSLAASLAMIFVPLGYGGLYFGVLTLISATVIFIFSIFETKAELFDCKDNDLLLSLPIKPRDILISRIFTVLFYNYIIEALIALPATVCYLIFGGSPLALIGSAIVFVMTPLFATALSSGVGYIVAIIGRRFRSKTLITIILSLAFLSAYFIGYGYLINGIDALLENLATNAASINESAALIVFIGEASLLYPLPLIAFVVICAGVTFLAYAVIARNYISVITDVRGAKRAIYRARSHDQKSAVAALVRKELSRLTSSATYMLNGAMGIFFGLLIVGAVIFASDGVILAIVPVLEQFGVTNAIEVIAPAMIMVLVLVSSMNMISASALSLEGGSLWIIKSMPLTSKQILIAKAIPNALVTAPPFLLFSVVVAVAIGAPAHYYPIYVLMPAVVAVMTSLLGIILNVAFPKFDYVNEAQVVKQSLPVFLALLVPVIIMMPAVAIVLAASVSGFGVVALWLVLAAFVGISVLLYLILSGPAARRLDAIER